MQGSLRINIHHTKGRCDQDVAVLIFQDRTDRGRTQAVLSSVRRKLAVFQDEDTVVVGSDPKPALRVRVERDNAGDPRRRIIPVKSIAVVAEKSAVGAYPDKPFFSLDDGVGVGRCKSVGVVVEN